MRLRRLGGLAAGGRTLDDPRGETGHSLIRDWRDVSVFSLANASFIRPIRPIRPIPPEPAPAYMTGSTLVIQSHRMPLPYPWLEDCLASVQRWAAGLEYDYRFLDDALFDSLPEDLVNRTARQPVIAADLARLRALKQGLDEGFATVIWCDADLLVFDPVRLKLSDERYALGREVWVQQDDNRLRGNPFLDFYQHAAERLVRAHAGSGKMAPQFVGPKLLTALHNIVGCPVTETAAMLSPLVARNLLAGGGEALTLFRKRSTEPPAAFNLCASLVAIEELSSVQVDELIELLLKDFAWS